MDLDLLTNRLASDDPETQTRAVESIAAEVARAAEACVAALGRGPNRFLIAERLHWLGTAAVRPLERLIAEDGDSEARVLGAVVLLQLGSRAGAPLLLDAIRTGHPDSTLAAMWLAKSGVTEVGDMVERELDCSDLSNVDRDLAYMDVLKVLGRPLPVSFARRAQEDAAPWQLRLVMAQDNQAAAAQAPRGKS